MPALSQSPSNPRIIESARRRLRDRVEAEAYVASVCFKHGPPRLTGVELEWIVHHADDPRRPLDARRLADALGPHTPRTLNPESPEVPLPAGSPLSLEPGGQVEISTLPQPTLRRLVDAVQADLAYLTGLLSDAGLVLGDHATDRHRPPRRLLNTPRYVAMERVFEPIGPHGRTMMCATAGLQVCLDTGEPDTAAARWTAVSALGPVLVAAFANSPGDGWASARMRAVLGTDPPRSSPSRIVADPAADWARRVLDTPVLCVRDDGDDWATPGVTFADWLAGALPSGPTADDLDYHLSTMFPPVRPHGYLEVRYLDAQPGDAWLTPVALLLALLSTPRTVDAVLDACLPVGDRWLPAARDGLADRALATAAAAVLDLGARALPGLGLGHDLTGAVLADLDRLHERSVR
ncbi:glutamate-cysteine ligase family protein [Actinophytocola gossypii]|uniref:Glutamate--cysteine ligase EgtA n=1 Tax=Actinophytocola gossypii TaxID=2812003 RepID=A0ABT2JGS8_9PSEU|nr:glutamate-cysteine ligase family protein [Actinophytocola gossypii]MCT2587082.1 ergothioneine biosynthesis glutamate--cysteine ligase EgtA [Actinophytocola gossypii]